MIHYLLRRILYILPILLGINVLTFILFFMVNSPDDMARMQLGHKHITEADIKQWKVSRGYDVPLFYNEEALGLERVTKTLFVQKSFRLFLFDFGRSESGRDIGRDVSQRMWPSLSIAAPAFVLGLWVTILFAMMMAFFRLTPLDLSGVVLCVVLMSVSTMFFIIGGQYVFGKMLKLVPISGYDVGFNGIKFLLLPIFIEVVAGLGAGSRWYRTLFLQEMNKDYVKTARAKGLSEVQVLFRHVLKNAMLPILTGIVVLIPSLFMGSLVLESFFSIPGLGSYMIDAIVQQDFAIVRAMVFLGSVLYIVGLILTDIAYTFVDPRVRLK